MARIVCGECDRPVEGTLLTHIKNFHPHLYNWFMEQSNEKKKVKTKIPA